MKSAAKNITEIVMKFSGVSDTTKVSAQRAAAHIARNNCDFLKIPDVFNLCLIFAQYQYQHTKSNSKTYSPTNQAIFNFHITRLLTITG